MLIYVLGRSGASVESEGRGFESRSSRHAET